MPLPRTLIYTRDEENRADQIADAVKYARDTFEIELPTEAIRPPFNRDTADTLRDYNIAWSGDDQDTYPETLEAELRMARDGRIDRFIVPHLYTFSGSLRDIHGTIDSLHAAGVTVGVSARKVMLDPTNADGRAHDARRLLADAAEAERRDNQRQIDTTTTGERHTGGRPPLGYVVDDGHRRPGPEYDAVEATLHDVIAGDVSIRGAAARLNVSRTTIRNAVEKRPDLYDLPADAQLPNE